MLIALSILGGALLIAIVLVVALQKALLTLSRASDDKRKDSKTEIESGIKGMLDNSEKTFNQLVSTLKEQVKESRREITNLRTQNSAIREQLASTAKATEGLQASTEGLKNLLANNRLRGEWGEQVAEDLLLAAGFVEKVNFVKQTTTSEGRPDFTLMLPDGSKINVDAKFPFDDLIAYQEAKTPAEKRKALSSFRTAIKEKVKGITSKDYINPEDQTVDFVIMFIPNEMIFSFIYEKLPEMSQYCNERKVILAGPFGFTAVLRLVLQAYKNFQYEKGLQNILGLINKFQDEYQKFGEHMDRLGKQLDTAQKTYHEVEGTRSRQLTRLVDRINEQSHREGLEESENKAIDSGK